MFYFTYLPVFGELGPNTELDSNVHPPVVRKLHCLLDTVPSSDIWRIYPCVIMGAELADKLRQSGCSGYEFRAAIFEAGDAFRHFHGNKTLPEFHWCHVTGKAYTNDLGLAEGSKLVISVNVKRLIETGNHEDVSFVGGDHPPSQEEISAKVWADAARVAEELKAKAKGKPRTGWFAPTQS